MNTPPPFRRYPEAERPEESLMQRIRDDIAAVGAQIEEHARDDERRHEAQIDALATLTKRLDVVEDEKVRVARESLAEAKAQIAERAREDRAAEAKRREIWLTAILGVLGVVVVAIAGYVFTHLPK